MITIDSLKNDGWEVDVIHERRYRIVRKLTGVANVIQPRGGRTTVILTDSHRGAFSGTSICSDEDNYCKKLGVKVGLARAMVQIPELQSKVPNLFL